MQVRQIDTEDKKDIARFVQFPFRLYKNNPYWVPPLKGELEKVMDKKHHPFYQHSDGAFFVVEDENEVLGRIAALRNNNFCKYHNVNCGFFYYFECINDPGVSSLLFGAAENWAKEHACDQMLGPKGFLRSNGLGMLVEGFNSLPAMGIPYNLEYYPELVCQSGYTKETDNFSGYLDHRLNSRLHQAADRVKQRGQFWIKNFSSKSEMKSWISRIEEVHDQAFQEYPWYYPSTPEEFQLLAENIIAISDPKMIKFIMHGDQVAGFILAYPNINKAIQRTRGRIFPLGWIDLLITRKFTPAVDLNGVGLLPQYQGLGGNALLYSEVEKVIANSGKKYGEIIQVDERNFRSKSDMDFMEVVWHKTHRTYRKSLL